MNNNLENIKIENKNGEMVVSSREVAENFEKRHTEVLRTIQEKISQNAILRSDKYFIETSYKAGTGKEYKEYLMTRDGFSFLVMGFTGAKADEWKLKYIEAFNKMEEVIKEQSKYKIPKTPMEALTLMFEVEKENAEKIEKLDNRMLEIEENTPLNPGEYNLINSKVSERIRIIKRERGLEKVTREQNSALFKAINSEIKTITGVRTRSQLRSKHLEMVLDFIRDWEPSKATMVVVNQLSLEI